MSIVLNNCPSTLAEGFETYSDVAAVKLFDGQVVSPFLDFDLNANKLSEAVSEALNRISVSGVQEKFAAVVKNGRICIADNGERSTHILKPSPWDATISLRHEIPANENLTMQIASQVYGIETAPNGLCFSKNGKAVYITKIFDVAADGSKFMMEDFSSVVGRSEATGGKHFKYDGCYADIANAISNVSSDVDSDLMKFFKILVFNYIHANGDAHLKNFSLINDADGRSRLAPAYDLINTSLHVKDSDFALEGGLSPDIEKSEVYMKFGHPCRIDFERFGSHIGLSEDIVGKVLDCFMDVPQLSKTLIDNSFLSQRMKRSYLRSVNERVSRFVRR